MQLPGQDGMRLLDRDVNRRVAPHLLAYVVGATHNGANRNWHRDESLDQPNGAVPSSCDEAAKLAPWRQRALIDAVVVDWFEAMVRHRRETTPAWLRGDEPIPPQVAAAIGGPVDLRVSYLPPEKMIVDSFDGDDSPRRNDLGGLNQISGFSAGGRCFASHCDDDFAHTVWGARLEWSQPGAIAAFEIPETDAGGWDAVSFRLVQNARSPLVQAGRAADASVVLVDASGQRAVVALATSGGIPFPSTLARSTEQMRHFHGVMQTVRVPLERFRAANPQLDLSRVVSIELRFDRPGSERGSIVLSHIELTRG